MAILLRNEGGRWRKVSKMEFKDETELQQLLFQSPELVDTTDEACSIVFTRESGLPGSGYTDLIGVDSSGRVLIIETKLARNREIRRTVIGQVLEYAAFLWGMPFDEFDRFFIAKQGKSLLDLMQEKDPAINREQLRTNIAEKLATADFDLLIAVDSINPELDKIIAFLGNRSIALKFEALEIELYKQEQTEVLVPRRRGQLSSPSQQSGDGTRKKLNMSEVIASCPTAHSRELLEFVNTTWLGLGNAVVPGTVGASFRALVNGEEQVIFWAYPDSIQAAFNVLLKAGAPADAVNDYRRGLSKLTGFNAPKLLNESQPITRWDVVSSDSVRQFVAESQRLVELWRNIQDGGL